MKGFKNKKGFTLVELIVVMAIISIMAVVAVPSALHFVEMAKQSNDQQAINVLENLTGYFIATNGPEKDKINMAVEPEGQVSTFSMFSFEDEDVKPKVNGLITIIESDEGTLEARKYINKIEFTFENTTGERYTIYAKIFGQKDAETEQVVEGKVGEVTSLDNILKGDKDAQEVVKTYKQITFIFDSEGSGKVTGVYVKAD